MNIIQTTYNDDKNIPIFQNIEIDIHFLIIPYFPLHVHKNNTN